MTKFNMSAFKNKNILAAGLASLFLAPISLQADDTDLFKSNVEIPTRIMVLMDTSTSMSANIGASATEAYTGNCPDSDANRKICIVKRLMSTFLSDESNENYWPDYLEVGIARYGRPGAIILGDIKRLDEVTGDGRTHRDDLQEAIDDLKVRYHSNNDVGNHTPLIGSYVDVAEYMVGGQPLSSFSTAYSVDVFNDTSTLYDGENLAPVCGINSSHVVVLTDGLSKCETMSGNLNGHWNIACKTSGYYGDAGGTLHGNDIGKRINTLANGAGDYHSNCPSNTSTGSPAYQDATNGNPWGCLNTVADALKDKKDINNVSNSVTSHVIGFDIGSDETIQNNMTTWANTGGGGYYAANDGTDLANAFTEISRQALASGSFSVAAAGVSVGENNVFTHLDEIYFSAIQPTDKQFWYGNLKKYFTGFKDGSLEIYANEGKTQLAAEDGVFKDGIMSEWSVVDAANYGADTIRTLDGNVAYLGGAASNIPEVSDRKLYTYIGDTRHEITTDAGLIAVKTKLAGEYASEFDTALTADATAAYNTTLDSVLSWLKGVDENDEWLSLSGEASDARPAERRELRNFYGTPLHSSPVLVNYKSLNTDSTPLTTPENVVFISANDGKLYAVDSDNGVEKLAFIPEAMLTRNNENSAVEKMYNATKNDLSGQLLYGLDSTWTVWRQDTDNNGNIDSGNSSNDFVYLYGGMRRGGKNYYILDATEVNDASPQIEQIHVIEGGAAGTEFENSGQSWSKPTLAIIQFNGKAVPVFIIGGGYDPVYDSGRPDSGTTPMGAQVYIIAALDFTVDSTDYETGDVLWWSSSESSNMSNHVQNANLTYSIPSKVKLFELDGDGFLDFFYVGDMGGQIHRFDINLGNSGSANLVSNGTDTLVAKLGVSNSILTDADANDRRFFYPPSIAWMGDHIGVTIGSGWRSNPKDQTVTEKFYYIKDFEPVSGTAQAAITESDYTQNGTTRVIVELSKVTSKSDLSKLSVNTEILGYSYELEENAEKLMGSPLLVGGDVYFTTYYQPASSVVDLNTCQAEGGKAAVYLFTPGNAQTLQAATGLSQNVAGSIQVLINETLPEPPEDGSDTTEPTKVDGGLLSGTGAIGTPDIDFKKVRKVKWRRMSAEEIKASTESE